MKPSKLAYFLISFSAFCFLLFATAFAATPEELRKSIEQKSQDLQALNAQIQENQQKLEEVRGQKQTLQKDLNSTDKQIKQLNLSIRSSEITIEKLGLELDSLQYKISDSEKKILTKKEAIAETLREIQKNENESPLIIFLKNKTLAESVFNLQSLADFNDNLTSDIAELRSLKIEMDKTLNNTTDKKQAKENENVYLKNKKSITEDVKKEKQVILNETKNKESNYQKQLEELEKLQAEISVEIGKTEEELRLKINPSMLPTPRAGILEMPVLGKLTQGYGDTDYARRNYKSKWHNGVDFGAPIGTPVVAAENGRVIFVGDQDNYLTNGKRLCYHGAYGKVVVVKHENNLTTLYGHLSLYVVKIGDNVQRGQLIGYIGKTGWSTGPHLHFNVYASYTMPPATPGFPEGTKASRVCGPMPVGGDLNPLNYL